MIEDVRPQQLHILGVSLNSEFERHPNLLINADFFKIGLTFSDFCAYASINLNLSQISNSLNFTAGGISVNEELNDADKMNFCF